MSSWKTPNEIIQIQRLKKRTNALKARLERPMSLTNPSMDRNLSYQDALKRTNPFADTHLVNPKRVKTDVDSLLVAPTICSEDSIFGYLSSFVTDETVAEKEPDLKRLAQQSHDSIDHQEDQDSVQIPTSHIPIDWGLKSKIRLLTLSRITITGLKTCQEASGITNFVRCLTPKTASESLDISLGTRIYQASMYWQHPHIPWLTLFPRDIRSNQEFSLGELERETLAKEWSDSFRALFQLLRARQCAYFYVCANTFTVLFCAAGIGGRDEQHAYITPISRGMRVALKQEEIEFSMPLKTTTFFNKSPESEIETFRSKLSNVSEHTTEPLSNVECNDGDEDEDQEEWLASLGVDSSEIRKLGTMSGRLARNAECAEDFGDHSIALIEGIECQAFFNFLLHSKSTISKSGRLAGIPPTLLASVAFPGATLRSLQTRASQIHMEGVEYHSLELKGVILPHVLPYLCGIIRESKDTFSASLTGSAGTKALSRAAQQLMQERNQVDVFCRENLSDCGLPASIIEAMCRCKVDAVRSLERICFSKEAGGYTWS